MAQRLFISEAASLALHTMAVLASDADRRWTNQQLAGVLAASGNHLAKVMQRLSRAGLVDAVVGPHGGFRLARPAEEIRLLEIYQLVEGPPDWKGCLLADTICDGAGCGLGGVIQSLWGQWREYLGRTTLAELANGVALSRRLAGLEGPAENREE